ncbi:DUF4873 domain-containing protein [Salinactinospora qingdaonensis]|uniref:DUF4873 domain-containing protein n=1 Tax=Salinactinospora qingdaonensis TaxID=702744 RepID=A0ABP7F2J0_9ACTN
MSDIDEAEEEYRGAVTVTAGDRTIEVRAHLAGHFDPLNGHYRWVGRLSPAAEITTAFEAGHTDVLVRTPEGHTARATLSAPNVWGGHGLAGTGRPPFPVPHVIPDE